jgi:transposase InsO family protein
MSGPYIAPDERDCLFGTYCDAQSARGAEIRRHDEGLLAPMRERFDPALEAQTSAIFLRQDAEFKHVKRTGGHTRPFAFALVSINDWREDTGTLAACAGRIF